MLVKMAVRPIALMLVGLLLLVGCSLGISSEVSGPDSGVGLANPASTNCIEQGGAIDIRERGDGGQYGVCFFEDNLQCEEWAMLRGDCPVGGLHITGYATDAAVYCAITGGTYVGGSLDADGVEQGSARSPRVIRAMHGPTSMANAPHLRDNPAIRPAGG